MMFHVKILTAVTGWDKFLHLLRIFGMHMRNATHLKTQNSPDLSRKFGSLPQSNLSLSIYVVCTDTFYQ